MDFVIRLYNSETEVLSPAQLVMLPTNNITTEHALVTPSRASVHACSLSICRPLRVVHRLVWIWLAVSIFFGARLIGMVLVVFINPFYY